MDNVCGACTGGDTLEGMMSTAGVSDKASILWYLCAFAIPYGIAFRPVCVLRPGLDVVCAPRSPDTETFWAWAAEHYGLESWQVLWYPIAPLERLHVQVLSTARSIAALQNREILLVPYMPTVPSHRWLSFSLLAKGMAVLGGPADAALAKDCLHPVPENGASSVLEGHLRHPVTKALTDIRVPRGFRCETRQHLRDAYAALSKAGLKVAVKPSGGSHGAGVLFDVSEKQIQGLDLAAGVICLEEVLQRDRQPDGPFVLPMIHFVGCNMFGDNVQQVVKDDKEYCGTMHPTDYPEPLLDRLRALACTLAGVFQFQGLWGVDLVLQDGEPFLVDLNVRLCASHVPRIFVSMHAPGQPWKYWQQKLSPELLDPTTLSMHLQRLQLQFTPKAGRGLVSLGRLLEREPDLVQLLAIGVDKADLDGVLDTWNAHVI